MAAFTPTETANLALDELRYEAITYWNEDTLQAEKARLHYPVVLAEEAERGEWAFARTRASLATVSNDREAEWSYAFALPNDMAFPVRVLSAVAGSTGGYVPMVGQSLSTGMIPGDDVGLRYDMAGGYLYTSISTPILEYISNTAEITGASALFHRAVVLELASRLAIPLIGDRGERDRLRQEALMVRSEAQALNNNSRPQTYGDFLPEAAAARMGYDPAFPAGYGFRRF